MRWSDRQRALLREIGLQPWGPASAAAAASVPASPAPDVAPAVAAPAVAEAKAAAPAARAPVVAERARPSNALAPVAPPAATALPPVDRSAVATLDWPALREAVGGCRACELCSTRKQTVFGVGHPNARWMVIGEAPGQQEDEQGEPFVGAAGQLLDAMLRSIGLSRAAEGDPDRRVFIANTLKCRPPGNRNPKPEEMAQCEPFLVRQIELVKPALILAMGRFAVQALLRSSEPIGKLRGRVHRYEGVPLVVTYHPAYLLRNLPDKARAWEDLCLALDVAEQAGLPTGPAPAG